jgi:hypothetical protein
MGFETGRAATSKQYDARSMAVTLTHTLAKLTTQITNLASRT